MVFILFIGMLVICTGILELLIKFKGKIGKTLYTTGIILINISVIVGMAVATLTIIKETMDMVQILIMAFILYMFFTLERASLSCESAEKD